MKALILTANGELTYTETPVPERPGARWSLIRVAAAGICGSDIHRAFGDGAYYYPLIMGHEFSGVVEVPAEDGRLEAGRRVTVFPLIPCHECRACRIGEYAQCSNYDYIGSRRNGAFAEYVWAPEENLFAVPEAVDLLHAAMTEPCAVALHGVRKLPVRGDETAVVFGAGPIGNMVSQWLRIRGCERILVVDIDERKLMFAKEMGFVPIDSRAVDPVASVRDLTEGTGAAISIEACGLPLTYRQAVASAATFGTVLLLGNITGEWRMDQTEVSAVLRKELTLLGTWNSKITPQDGDDWSTALRSLGRDLTVEELISHTPSLEEGADIFGRLHDRCEYFGKVVFRV